MKKLLIGAAVAGLTFGLAAQANAQVKLDLGGHFKGYGAYVSQDNRGSQRALWDNNAGNNAPGVVTVGTDQRDQVAIGGLSERHTAILRETEIHFTGETTLDNGLTVGFHAEADIDSPTGDVFGTEEAYAYFSGAWGRVNFGKEDGAAYLLQVAAPSADSNVDGIRQYIQPVNYDILGHSGRVARVGDSVNQNGARGQNLSLQDLYGSAQADGIGGFPGIGLVGGGNVIGSTVRFADATLVNAVGDIRVGNTATPALNRAFGYDQAVTGTFNKLTYLTPVFSGFQAGVSYTPEFEGTRDLNGVIVKDSNQFGDAWDLAARYEGQFGEVGLAIGAGWTHAERRNAPANNVVFYRENGGVAGGAGGVNGVNGYDAGVDTVLSRLDDRKAWNVGIDLNWGPFGIGAIYTEDDNGISSGFDRDTWVVGIDYTTGPFKIGASYLNQDQEFGPAEIETDRYSLGLTYTYGPGMSFRGSVSYIDHDTNVGFAKTSADATSVLLGTQIDF